MNEKFEIIKMLFEKHTSEFENKRKKIHSTTEKYITLILALFAWINTGMREINCDLKIYFSISILIIMCVALYTIFRDNKYSLEHAKVIKTLNESLGVFEKGKLVENKILYSEKWKKYGDEKKIKGVIIHFIVIILLTAVVIVATYVS